MPDQMRPLRMCGDRTVQVGDHLAMSAHRYAGSEVVLHGGEAQSAESRRRTESPRFGGEDPERRCRVEAGPQRQCIVEAPERLARRSIPGLQDEGLEAIRVEFVSAQFDRIAIRVPNDPTVT